MPLTQLTIILDTSGLIDINDSPVRLKCVQRTLMSDGTIGSDDSVCAVRAMPMDREIIQDLSIPEQLEDTWPLIRGRVSYLEATLPYGLYSVAVCVNAQQKQLAYHEDQGKLVPHVIFTRLGDHSRLPPHLGIGRVNIVDASKWRVVPKLEKRKSRKKPFDWSTFKMSY